MSLHKHRLHRRDSFPSPSGSVVISDTTPTGSVLAQNTATPPSGAVSIPPIPLVASTAQTPFTPTTSSSTPTATVSSTATSSSSQISLGAVIGACVAALVVLLLSVSLAFYCSKRHQKFAARALSRNATNNASRRRSHLEPWKRMDDTSDRWVDQNQSPMKQRPPSGPLGAMFRRTISNTSAEKSDGGNRESVGTMQHFAKYHPGLAAEMASQGAMSGVDKPLAKPAPVLHLMNRGSNTTAPMSWDGDTVRGDSFFSVQSNSKTSFMMATEKATPPAMPSTLHRWESAEVLHVGQTESDASDLQNPFSDKASSVKSRSSRGHNPFFGAQDHPIKRTLLPDTHENPFADSNAAPDSSADAIRSLIAALEAPHVDRIVSLQSSVYSRATADDGESAISVTAFPYPPTVINLR